ncbi:hypothetical protein CP533_0141 [Ophiocordyceps camponoti-saundersi (nom. inval.)]|nr:hypothetical protein CP533_0141 [Ophiocordyceps camponoti-saundersi (nom. inval.)]
MNSFQFDARLTGPAFEKPVPRQPKTAEQKASIQVQNRRREYLERNPSYLEDPEHELAGKLSGSALTGRTRPLTYVLLYERLITRFQTEEERLDSDIAKGYDHVVQAHAARTASSPRTPSKKKTTVYHLSDEDPWSVCVANKDHGRQLWRQFLRRRFLNGDDADFNYPSVDLDEGLDVEAFKAAEEAWFDDEEPAWADDTAGEEQKGETGIQDF